MVAEAAALAEHEGRFVPDAVTALVIEADGGRGRHRQQPLVVVQGQPVAGPQRELAFAHPPLALARPPAPAAAFFQAILQRVFAEAGRGGKEIEQRRRLGDRPAPGFGGKEC